MNNDVHLLLAQIPEPTRVLGIELRPFSLGHHLLLRRILYREGDSGVAEIETKANLLLACFVCSQTFEEGIHAIRSRWFSVALRLWKWRARKLDWNQEIVAFHDYMKQGFSSPDLMRPAKGKVLGGPWENRLKVRLMSRLNISESEVFNRPLALCQMDDASIAEIDGHIDFRGSVEDALIKKAREMAEEDLSA